MEFTLKQSTYHSKSRIVFADAEENKMKCSTQLKRVMVASIVFASVDETDSYSDIFLYSAPSGLAIVGAAWNTSSTVSPLESLP